MTAKKPPMSWNSWNTFEENINERLIMEIADQLVNDEYKDAGYNYVIIDDCCSLKEPVNGKPVPDPKLFPSGIKALSDDIHSKGLKFIMYSCTGTKTCAGYPSSYGHEFEDARQFAEWGVDYLKYDFCNFPVSGDAKNAYLTMAIALRHTGHEILFAACNWGKYDPSEHAQNMGSSFNDLGIHSESALFLKLTDAATGEKMGTFQDAYATTLSGNQFQVLIAELVQPEK